MKILFLTSAHNSLSQRLLIELTDRGHQVVVTLATSHEAMLKWVDENAPDLYSETAAQRDWLVEVTAHRSMAVWSRHLPAHYRLRVKERADRTDPDAIRIMRGVGNMFIPMRE